MTGPEHYKRAEALIRRSNGDEPETAAIRLAEAQVHATLALAAATAMAGTRGMGYRDSVAWLEMAATSKDPEGGE